MILPRAWEPTIRTFKRIMEVWISGQHELRNVYACIGAWAVKLVLLSLVET
jgi:hypothetical protein